MYITIHEQDSVMVVNVYGKLDIQSHLPFKAKVRELAGDDGYRKILVDVSGIKEIDSTGLGVLVAMLNSARKHKGGDLRLAGIFEPEVGAAFELCGLSRVIKRYSDVKSGIRLWNAENGPGTI